MKFYVNYYGNDVEWEIEKKQVLDAINEMCVETLNTSERNVFKMNSPPCDEKRSKELNSAIDKMIISNNLHLLLDIGRSGSIYNAEDYFVICLRGKYEKYGSCDSTFENPTNFIGYHERINAETKKVWAIQWISAESDMYEQIDTTAIYSSATSVLTAINEIIAGKKRDIEVDGVPAPREFAVFTEERLNAMEVDSWETIWEYHDALVIVTARQIY